jgi:hypothetical protein
LIPLDGMKKNLEVQQQGYDLKIKSERDSEMNGPISKRSIPHYFVI